jgi:hypothetical protein
VTEFEIVTATSPSTSSSAKSSAALCPAGKKPLGGGGSVGPDIVQLALAQSLPTAAGWTVRAYETSPVPGNWFVRAYVVCAKVG